MRRPPTTRARTSPQEPAEAEAAGEAAKTYAQCLYRRGEDPRSRAADVRDHAGDRGPRGHSRLPRRRQDRPLRRELRHPVRPDVRGGVSRSTSARCTSTGPSTSRSTGRPISPRPHASFDDAPRRDPQRVRRTARMPRRLRGSDTPRRVRRASREAASSPIEYDFPMGDGTTQRRSFTEADFEDAVAGYMYSEFDRSVLTRALAATVDGNLVPLARLAAAAADHSTRIPSSRSPIPPGPTPCTTPSSARTTSTRPDESTDADRLVRTSMPPETLGVTSSRLPSIYYGDMPCLYWPNHPAADPRPAAIVDAPYPTWIMVGHRRPDHAPRERDPPRRPAPRRARDRRDRRPPRDLRLGPVVPRRRRRGLPGQGQGAREPDHDLQGQRRRPVRAPGQGHRGRLPGRARR